jgi:arylsulfatase
VPLRIPLAGIIKPGTGPTMYSSHTDMLPTLAAVGRRADVVEKLKKGLQGRATRPSKSTSTATTCCHSSRARSREPAERASSTGATTGDPDGAARRQLEGRVMQQRAQRVRRLERAARSRFGRRTLQPAERSVRARSEDATLFYDKWMADRAFLLVPAQAIVGEFLKTFRSSRRARSRRASASTRRSTRRGRVRRP